MALTLTRRARDAEAQFEAWFGELYPSAYRVAYRLLFNAAAAEDTAAEAFTRAFARWSHVGTLPYRDAWLLRVTTNLALTALSRRPPPLVEPASITIDDSAATRLALGAALAALSSRQRDVIALRYLADLSEADVASALGISPGTVKTHLKRGLESLRDGFTENRDER